MLAIDIQEDRAKVDHWVRRTGVTAPVLLDPTGDVTSTYRVTGTPTAFLVGRDGSLIAKAIGAKPWLSSDGRALLEALLR